MSIGYKGMSYVVKVFSMMMVDLYENFDLVQEIQVEYKECKGDYEYEVILLEGLLLIGN